MQSDIVTVQHKTYSIARELRELVIDLRGGTPALRAKHAKYLPKFGAESDASYKLRSSQATLHNLYDQTEEAISGLAHKDAIEYDGVPQPMIDLFDNIDSEKNNLDVFSKEAFKGMMEGHGLILVDYPQKNEQITNAATESQFDRRPYWIWFNANQITNWKTQRNVFNNQIELSLLVLHEPTTKDTGFFMQETQDQYRVFWLDDQHIALWQLWQETTNKKGKKEFVKVTAEMPLLKDNGDPVLNIPVGIAYGCKIEFLVSKPPLLDAAYKNVEHYQDYSDFRTLKHKTAVPVPVAKGLNPAAIKAIAGDKLIDVGTEGDFSFVEITGTSLEILRESLKDVERHIGLLGLSAVVEDAQQRQGDITATEILYDSIEETAKIATMTASLKDAMETAMVFTADYMGLESETLGSIIHGTAWKKSEDDQEIEPKGERPTAIGEIEDILNGTSPIISETGNVA